MIRFYIYVADDYLGYGDIDIPDRAETYPSTTIDKIDVVGTAWINSDVLGSATGQIEDYVAYGSGGSRTVDLPFVFYIDQVNVGSGTIQYTDNYAPVSGALIPGMPMGSLIDIIMVLVFIVMIIGIIASIAG